MNPYAQGGWPNPQNPHSINGPSWQTPAFRQPSVAGALPSLESSATSGPLTFRFRSQYPDILNSTLYGPNNSDYIEIVTNQNTTYFRKKDATVFATIDWSGREPVVSISGFFDSLSAKTWIPRMPDGRRMMYSPRNKAPYTWVTQPQQINLYAVGSFITHTLATISRGQHSVTLNITADAIQAGLLESSIVATVLMQSGRHLD